VIRASKAKAPRAEGFGANPTDMIAAPEAEPTLARFLSHILFFII